MRKILIAEDDKNELDSLRRTLEKAGFEVITASDGESALLLLSSTDLDLAILDIAMPVMNGMQVLEKIRLNSETASLPVIMLTNLDTDDAKLNQINRDKPVYYLIKANTQLNDLVDKVNSVFGIQP